MICIFAIQMQMWCLSHPILLYTMNLKYSVMDQQDNHGTLESKSIEHRAEVAVSWRIWNEKLAEWGQWILFRLGGCQNVWCVLFFHYCWGMLFHVKQIINLNIYSQDMLRKIAFNNRWNYWWGYLMGVLWSKV